MIAMSNMRTVTFGKMDMIMLRTFNSLFSRTTWVSRLQTGKPFWILLKQEMMGGSGISWTICKSFAPHSRQIAMPVPHHWIFYAPDALPDAQPTVLKHWRQDMIMVLSKILVLTAWLMIGAKPNLWSAFWSKSSATAPWISVLIFHLTEGRRLGVPMWLVTYPDGIPMSEWLRCSALIRFHHSSCVLIMLMSTMLLPHCLWCNDATKAAILILLGKIMA